MKKRAYYKVSILLILLLFLTILIKFGLNWWKKSSLNKNKPEYFQDIIEIKKIPLSGSWTNGFFSYQLKNAYFIPYRGDLGKDYWDLMQLEVTPNDQIVAVEFSVRNISTAEDSKEVDLVNNFRIRDGDGLESSPTNLPLTLPSQTEIITYFVYFSVKKSKNNPKLLVGPLDKPALFDLNIDTKNVESVCGTYAALRGDGFPSLSRNIDCNNIDKLPGRVNVNTLTK